MSVQEIQEVIHQLYNLLSQHTEQSKQLKDISDVLAQVYKNLESKNDPSAVINRLVNYIYITAFGCVHLDKEEEQLLSQLAAYGSRAGLNSSYRGNAGDKSQFFSIVDSFNY